MTTDFYNKCLEECYTDQEQAKVLDSNNHTIIKAGPGSGKTRVLTLKAAKLLFENIEIPRGIACITYTNKATQELKNRLNLYGIKSRKNLFVDTIHKFCINNILLPFSKLYNDYEIKKIYMANRSKIGFDGQRASFTTEIMKKENELNQQYRYRQFGGDETDAVKRCRLAEQQIKDMLNEKE